MTKKPKTPWPTKDVMNQVYEKKLWGGIDFDFYSGEGSHRPEIITPYLDAVSTFLNSYNGTLTVCDLGCGDFNIGKQLTSYTKKYIAIDIVESLIKRNKTLFKNDNLTFQCLDITKDDLPKGDCVILRQVLQHLSNQEIRNIVHKINTYKYVILTEHIPTGKFTPNKDIITGQGVRLKKNSGVNVLVKPFNLKITEVIRHSDVVLENNKGRISTSIYQCF
jgi:hypothetical protein